MNLWAQNRTSRGQLQEITGRLLTAWGLPSSALHIVQGSSVCGPIYAYVYVYDFTLVTTLAIPVMSILQ